MGRARWGVLLALAQRCPFVTQVAVRALLPAWPTARPKALSCQAYVIQPRCFLLNNTSTKSPVRQQCSRCSRCLSKCCRSRTAYIPWARIYAQVQLGADAFAAISSLAIFREHCSAHANKAAPERML